MVTADLILPGILLCCLALPLLLLRSLGRKPRLYLPPGPLGLPFIGNLHQLGKNLHRSLLRLANNYGPLMYLKLGSVSTLIISNADMAEEIHRLQDSVFCSRPTRTVPKRLFGGHGVVFASYSEGWRQRRKISMLELYTTKRVQSFRHIREEEVRILVKTITETSTAGQLSNISDMTLCLFNNIICRQAFGRRVSKDGECRRSKFHDQLREFIELLSILCLSDFFPAMGWLNKLTGLHSRLEKTFSIVDNLLEEEIENHLKPDNDDNRDFMSVLLHLQKDTSLGFSLTQEQIKSIILEIFLGGSDTSASAIEFGMLELALNPRVMKKAQEEVRRIVGGKAFVEESDLPRLVYLKLVVKEILRYRPPGPISLPHESLKDVKVCGYDIPAKTTVITNVWAIMRDPKFWKDPEVFWPERFEDSDLHFKGQDFQYIPFSSGRRICPGINLGVTGVELTLANLLHCFDWELPEGMEPEDLDTNEAGGVILRLKTPLQLKAKPVF
ncbi:unnamed protein product [Spirodela intermedia]|uniref:Uncharacterized protein n=1 Tax=Spirodela intermedia TaxID=51605 RepID=A0A7I8K0M5_SPIIN|nr:unnamed protein product [Spirodela intermedia]